MPHSHTWTWLRNLEHHLRHSRSLLSLSYRGDEPEVAFGITSEFPLDGAGRTNYVILC